MATKSARKRRATPAKAKRDPDNLGSVEMIYGKNRKIKYPLRAGSYIQRWRSCGTVFPRDIEAEQQIVIDIAGSKIPLGFSAAGKPEFFNYEIHGRYLCAAKGYLTIRRGCSERKLQYRWSM